MRSTILLYNDDGLLLSYCEQIKTHSLVYILLFGFLSIRHNLSTKHSKSQPFRNMANYHSMVDRLILYQQYFLGAMKDFWSQQLLNTNFVLLSKINFLHHLR